LNISRVFVSGSIEKLGQALLETIEREVRENWTYNQQGEFQISFTRLGENAVAYGAAGMFLEMIFAPPDSNPATKQLIGDL